MNPERKIICEKLIINFHSALIKEKTPAECKIQHCCFLFFMSHKKI